MKVSNFFLFSFLFFVLNQNFAQVYNYQYKLDRIASSGWYKIDLDDQLRANSKIDLSDVRILNGKDTIPYILKESATADKSEQFKTFKFYFESSHSLLVQTDKSKINTLQLKVSNHKDSRKFSVLGSNNKVNWYPISDLEFLSGSSGKDQLFYWQELTLPSFNYAFLRFTFLDSLSKVPNISSIISPYQLENGAPFQIVTGINFSIEEIGSDKLTRIKLFAKKPQWIHQISFDVKQPSFYHRQIKIYKNLEVQVNRNQRRVENEFLNEFSLKSDIANHFLFSHYLEDTLFIDILNDDNMPLEVSDIICFQRKIYLFTHLESGNSYTLLCGNAAASKPNYDLVSFASQIDEKQAMPLAYKLSNEKSLSEPTEDRKSFLEKPVFLWISLSVAALALVYFTLKLLRDKNITD